MQCSNNVSLPYTCLRSRSGLTLKEQQCLLELSISILDGCKYTKCLDDNQVCQFLFETMSLPECVCKKGFFSSDDGKSCLGKSYKYSSCPNNIDCKQLIRSSERISERIEVFLIPTRRILF
jgi:hypothetical protein